MSESPVHVVCEHGSLTRACRVCELEAEVADLRRQLQAWIAFRDGDTGVVMRLQEFLDTLKSRASTREGAIYDRIATREREAVEAFYARVNARAEADMLMGNPLAGAHCRAMQVEIETYRKARTA